MDLMELVLMDQDHQDPTEQALMDRLDRMHTEGCGDHIQVPNIHPDPPINQVHPIQDPIIQGSMRITKGMDPHPEAEVGVLEEIKPM